MNELVEKGIAALKSGDRPTARKLLASAVQQDMRDVTAWLWLATALDKDEERMSCLQRVLQIDPGNQAAAKGLAQILEQRTRAAAANAQPPMASAASPKTTSQQAAAPANTPAAPAPQIRSTPPPSNSPAALPAQNLETTQPARPAPVETTPPARIEPKPAPAFTVRPARAAVYPTPEPLSAEQKIEPPAQSNSAADALRAEFAAFQPTPEVEAPPEENFDFQVPAKPAVRDEPEVFDPAALRFETYQPGDDQPDLLEPEVLLEPATLAEPSFEEPVQPVAASNMVTATSIAGAPAAPTRQRKAATPDVLPTRVIFRTRPSMVPALLCFWLFFFGSVMVGNLLGKIPVMSTTVAFNKDIQLPLNTIFAAAMGLLLELVVLYTTLRIFTVRYELTNHYLWVYFRGKRARVPLEHIYQAECRHSLMQRIIGTGHLELDLAVHGELAHVRLRNIPDCKKRMDQIMYLVRDLI